MQATEKGLAIRNLLIAIYPDSIIGKKLAKLISLHNVPGVLLGLNNEINDLCYILRDISTRFEDTDITLHHHVLATVQETHFIARNLETWLSRLNIVGDANSEPNSDLSERLRFGAQLHRLKDGLRTNRLKLGILSDLSER